MAIRVIIVDDSPIVQKAFARELAADPELDVIDVASDPYVARDKIVELDPDVLTLDVEMPRMDGITFLRKLMRYHPIPVIVVSSLTPEGGRRALDALDAGAVDVMCKPGPESPVNEMAVELIGKIKVAASVRTAKRMSTLVRPTSPRNRLAARECRSGLVLALGISTGGVQALQQVLPVLPPQTPGMLIVQHMPPYIMRTFTARMNDTCALTVKEAEDGEVVEPGTVFVAPGDRHLLVGKTEDGYVTRVKDGPQVRHHRPSADVLFKSVAHHAGRDAIGVIMTGMGSDGARGLLKMREEGATTIAQDEESCTVFGMPREAIRLNAAEYVVPVRRIADAILEVASAERTV